MAPASNGRAGHAQNSPKLPRTAPSSFGQFLNCPVLPRTLAAMHLWVLAMGCRGGWMRAMLGICHCCVRGSW
eukprot:11075023-Alexandrium_andersonii.AAC.1